MAINPRALLRKRLESVSMRQLAREFGVSATYISDVMAGLREPGPAILEPLGLEVEVKTTRTYRRKKPAQTGSRKASRHA